MVIFVTDNDKAMNDCGDAIHDALSIWVGRHVNNELRENQLSDQSKTFLMVEMWYIIWPHCVLYNMIQAIP